MSLLKYYNTATSQWVPVVVGATGYTGSRGEQGTPGTSVKIVGSVANAGSLPDPYTGDIGDGYITSDTGHLWVWTGSTWNDVGTIIGYTGSRGDIGYTGSTGTAATVTIGTVSVSTTTATVTNVGDTYNAVFDFTLQQGPQGAVGYTGSTGTQGAVGYTGSTGTAATIAVGLVTISTSTASVTNVGDANNAVFDFTLQQGPQGEPGPQGPGADQDLNTTSSVTFANLTLLSGGVITFANGATQSGRAPRMVVDDDFINAPDYDAFFATLLPGDFYWSVTYSQIKILVDFGTYLDWQDLTVYGV